MTGYKKKNDYIEIIVRKQVEQQDGTGNGTEVKTVVGYKVSVAGIRFGFQTCDRQHIFIFLICANPRIRVLSFYHFFPLIDHDVSGFIPGRSVRLFCAV